MTEESKPECIPIDDDDNNNDDTNEPEEYSVESIRGKRKNPSTGITEFLIKWEGWPESDNSWEPIDNLKCPALIAEFEEEEKKKRKLRSATKGRPRKANNSQNLRSANKDSNNLNGQASSSTSSFLMENENTDEISNSTFPSTIAESSNSLENQQPNKDLTESTWHQPKGFARGLPIQEIVGSVVDDKNKLFFFVKWKDCPEIELIDVNEMEDKAPKKLCKWYRERLYFNIKTQSESLMAQ